MSCYWLKFPHKKEAGAQSEVCLTFQNKLQMFVNTMFVSTDSTEHFIDGKRVKYSTATAIYSFVTKGYSLEKSHCSELLSSGET